MSRELPIGFKVPMVQGILEDRKSQTRRLVPQPFAGGYYAGPVYLDVIPATSQHPKGFRFSADAVGGGAVLTEEFWPRFNIGDRLYVREQWRTFISLDALKEENRPINLLEGRKGAGILYVAGGNMAITNGPPRRWSYGDGVDCEEAYGKIRQGMHLPRWGSRLTLTVTDVRVERLLDISAADAMAEGLIYQNVIVDSHGHTGRHVEITADRYWGGHEEDGFEGHEDAVDAYIALWDGINGAGSAKANPWVVAYTFTHEIRNIDDKVAR